MRFHWEVGRFPGLDQSYSCFTNPLAGEEVDLIILHRGSAGGTFPVFGDIKVCEVQKAQNMLESYQNASCQFQVYFGMSKKSTMPPLHLQILWEAYCSIKSLCEQRTKEIKIHFGSRSTGTVCGYLFQALSTTSSRKINEKNAFAHCCLLQEPFSIHNNKLQITEH